MEKKSIKKNAILNFLRTLSSLVFPLITFPYTSRILEPDGAGKLNFANSIISYFGIIAALGIGTYGIRECAKIRDDRNKLSKLVKELLTINLLSTGFSYVLFFISLIFVPKFVEYRVVLYIYSISLFANTLSMEWLYSAMEDYGYITLRSFIFQCLSTICLFIFVKTKEDYIKCAIINIISNVGTSLINFINCKKYIYRGIKKLELRKHLKPIFILFAMSVSVSIYTLLDTSMLGFLSGDFEVGIYHAATKINKLVLTLVTSIGTVLLPRLAYYSGNNNKNEFDKLIYLNINIIFMFGLPSAFGLSILSEPIVLLLSGELYYKAILVSKILNPIIIIIGLSNVLGIQLFMPLSKEKYTLISVVIGAITNFTLNLILIPKYGSLGAAIATVIAELCVTITQIVLAVRLISLKPIIKNFFIYLFNSIIMAIIVYCIVVIVDNLFYKLIIGISFGIIIYFVLLLLEKNEFVLAFIKKTRISGIRNKL